MTESYKCACGQPFSGKGRTGVWERRCDCGAVIRIGYQQPGGVTMQQAKDAVLDFLNVPVGSKHKKHRQQVVNALAKHGVEKVNDLPSEKLAPFLKTLGLKP